ncbi:Phosphate transport system permease protein pstA [Serratia fonticola]|uniref:Phosphate transport system permease protein PstA n=1 Tax=Serratia fonticola TaxID=47917 RepID=A0A4U9TK53_SERFO|nr:Phosphate transport system permease protein pstA [Serratia fonticola]
MATMDMQNPVALAESRRKMQAWRRQKNRLALFLSMATMVFGLFWLVWILFSTITKGIDGMSLALFTEMTPPPNTAGGGLANAIAGSGLLILWATIFGTPLGIMAGIYLAEYGRKSWLAEVIRFINDILLSAPSIVVGLFVYTVVVAKMEHFSGWAGIIALALLQIPIVIRTTENMLKLVPDTLREAAYALGTPKWRMISAITLKASVSGIITGVAAGDCAYRRGNRPVAVYLAVESVLEHRPDAADRQPAGHHFQICHEPVCRMATAGLGRGVVDHPVRTVTEYPGACDFRQEKAFIKI